jgi:lipopolysaccharide export system protein LptA
VVRKLAILAVLALLPAALCALPAWAQSGVMAPRFDPSKPLQIEAGRLEADGGDRVVRFEGSVVVTQDDATLKSDVLLIYFEAAPQTSGGDGETGGPLGDLDQAGGTIEKLIALGRVELVQGDRKATADRAEYNNQKGTIALSGSPRVSQGRDVLAGAQILIHVASQRVNIVGGKTGRVSVTINPGGLAGQNKN